ncbi:MULTISPECIES: hypothetical protein [Actinokineospora]|uniref:Uncharacterized protein n=1 Tax=Actinokineospora fastidiosa TaxID=1816 RepID=A0A918GJ50_9PSEU|nr:MULTISPECIES: hypothetical protein [Actinokineospora]UVS77749.1 hypothetical protein Actkin_01468 [Actinokineospora sp. UTMC 2448]GGS41264.1 hypothetical protein GCM10010171_39880 [Actinokineospora fastidiosa]
MSLFSRIFGGGLPSGFPGQLDRDEAVAASAPVRGGGHLVATSLGLWVPEGEGTRRIGWHLVSKAAWAAGVFTITEAEEAGAAGSAVLLRDLAPRRIAVEQPGKLPQAVHQRVTGSIRSRHRQELPGGGAWFVQRKVPGRDGVVLQVRPDEGVDVEAVRAVAAEVAAKIEAARDPD